MKTVPLSVIIHTKNSAQTLSAALKSVEFADQIVVLDMHSQDETVKIAKKWGAQVYEVPDYGFVEPVRNKGIAKAKHDWVFLLDADEELTLELQEFVKDVVTAQTPLRFSSFNIPRVNMIFGAQMLEAGWWPDYHLRFFKKGSVTWNETIHSKPKVIGQVQDLPSDPQVALIHHNYDSVSEFLSRSNHYSTISSQQGSTAKTSIGSKALMESFSQEFFRRFFAWQGYKAGQRGLSISLLQAMSQFCVSLKDWEKSNFSKPSNELETIKVMEQFSAQLEYWIYDWKVKQGGIWSLWWMLKRKVAKLKSM